MTSTLSSSCALSSAKLSSHSAWSRPLENSFTQRPSSSFVSSIRVYTVQFAGRIYVLHAFQKKSKKDIATPQKDIDLIRHRLAAAERHYKERQNGS